VTKLKSQEPSAVSKTGKRFEWLARHVTAQFPSARVVPFIYTAATDARKYDAVSDCVYRFSPIFTEKSERAGMHGVNESVGIEGYLAMIDFYGALLTDLNY
jgi:carboxypeptidase PM20D1